MKIYILDETLTFDDTDAKHFNGKETTGRVVSVGFDDEAFSFVRSKIGNIHYGSWYNYTGLCALIGHCVSELGYEDPVPNFVFEKEVDPESSMPVVTMVSSDLSDIIDFDYVGFNILSQIEDVIKADNIRFEIDKKETKQIEPLN